MKGVIKRRVFSVKVPPLPAEKIYEKLASSIRSGYAEIRIEKGKALIDVVGTESQIRDTWSQVKRALTELWELYSLVSTGEASIEAIAREAGRTFPPETLVYALELRGYRASFDTDAGVLRTNAPAETVIELARRLAAIIDELRFRVQGTAAKRLVAAVAAGLGVEPDTVLEYAVRMRIMVEEDGRLVLREEWRRALRKLAVMLKGLQSGIGEEGPVP